MDMFDNWYFDYYVIYFLTSIRDIPNSDKATLPPFGPFGSPTQPINSNVSQKGVKDTKCDLCGELFTKKA